MASTYVSAGEDNFGSNGASSKIKFHVGIFVLNNIKMFFTKQNYKKKTNLVLYATKQYLRKMIIFLLRILLEKIAEKKTLCQFEKIKMKMKNSLFFTSINWSNSLIWFSQQTWFQCFIRIKK